MHAPISTNDDCASISEPELRTRFLTFRKFPTFLKFIYFFFFATEFSASSIDVNNTIIEYFIDLPGSEHPFSIHNVMIEAKKFQIAPGGWFDPSRVSFVFR